MISAIGRNVYERGCLRFFKKKKTFSNLKFSDLDLKTLSQHKLQVLSVLETALFDYPAVSNQIKANSRPNLMFLPDKKIKVNSLKFERKSFHVAELVGKNRAIIVGENTKVFISTYTHGWSGNYDNFPSVHLRDSHSLATNTFHHRNFYLSSNWMCEPEEQTASNSYFPSAE